MEDEYTTSIASSDLGFSKIETINDQDTVLANGIIEIIPLLAYYFQMRIVNTFNDDLDVKVINTITSEVFQVSFNGGFVGVVDRGVYQFTKIY